MSEPPLGGAARCPGRTRRRSGRGGSRQRHRCCDERRPGRAGSSGTDRGVVTRFGDDLSARAAEGVTGVIASPDPATGVPTRVVVQRLAIDVPVLPIAPEGGVLFPPDNPRELGWYKYGARPGSVQGSAVITGHTVHTGGGALDELDDLRAGDTVRVSTTNGTIGYRVSEVSILSKTQFAAGHRRSSAPRSLAGSC